MEKIFSLILISLITYQTNAQEERGSYCKCDVKGTEITKRENEQGVILNANYLKETINVKVINNTPDTIYIFKSYFDNDISISPYLYRFDKKKNEMNVSFLPLIPYLYTKYSDKLIIQDRIVSAYQTVYDFYKILPFHEYSFNVRSLNFKNSKKFIKDFDVYSLNKFQPIKKFKSEKLKKKNTPLFFVKIAYYTDINTICNSNAYFLDELKFNDDSKKFTIIRAELNE
jgi:hypothetical protein